MALIPNIERTYRKTQNIEEDTEIQRGCKKIIMEVGWECRELTIHTILLEDMD